jgi:hypothetical protein
MLLWQRSSVQMDHGLFGIFGRLFLEKSYDTLEVLIFGLW